MKTFYIFFNLLSSQQSSFLISSVTMSTRTEDQKRVFLNLHLDGMPPCIVPCKCALNLIRNSTAPWAKLTIKVAFI